MINPKYETTFLFCNCVKSVINQGKKTKEAVFATIEKILDVPSGMSNVQLAEFSVTDVVSEICDGGFPLSLFIKVFFEKKYPIWEMNLKTFVENPETVDGAFLKKTKIKLSGRDVIAKVELWQDVFQMRAENSGRMEHVIDVPVIMNLTHRDDGEVYFVVPFEEIIKNNRIFTRSIVVEDKTSIFSRGVAQVEWSVKINGESLYPVASMEYPVLSIAKEPEANKQFNMGSVPHRIEDVGITGATFIKKIQQLLKKHKGIC